MTTKKVLMTESENNISFYIDKRNQMSKLLKLLESPQLKIHLETIMSTSCPTNHKFDLKFWRGEKREHMDIVVFFYSQ